MTVLQAAPAAPGHRRGRRLVIAGSVLLTLSVLGAIVGVSLTIGRLDFSQFQRDVVYRGAHSASIPGTVRFTVDEALPGTGSGGSSMTVGIATTSATRPDPECTLTTAAGEVVRLTSSPFDNGLVNDADGRYSVIASARLSPGDYVANCSWQGEPSQAPTAGEFTAARTIGDADLDGVVGPVLGFLGVLGVTGLMFVVGVVLLIVGLVMGRRRGPDGGGGGLPQWTPPTAPQAWPPPAPPQAWTPAAPASPSWPPAAPAPAAPAPPAPAPPAPVPPAGPTPGPDSGWPRPPGQRGPGAVPAVGARPGGPTDQSASGSLPNLRDAVSTGSNGKVSAGV